MAYLDKIIEECEDDRRANSVNLIVSQTNNQILDQKRRIKDDDIKVEHKDDLEGYLAVQAFEKDFYGKGNVQLMREEGDSIRNRIVSVIGAKAIKD